MSESAKLPGMRSIVTDVVETGEKRNTRDRQMTPAERRRQLARAYPTWRETMRRSRAGSGSAMRCSPAGWRRARGSRVPIRCSSLLNSTCRSPIRRFRTVSWQTKTMYRQASDIDNKSFRPKQSLSPLYTGTADSIAAALADQSSCSIDSA